jgi:hypothetical protein
MNDSIKSVEFDPHSAGSIFINRTGEHLPASAESPFPYTSAGAGTSAVPFKLEMKEPWFPKVRETPETRGNMLIFRLNCLVDEWGLFKDMRAALSRELETPVLMRVFSEFDTETNQLIARLQITAFGSDDRTLIKVTRIARDTDLGISESIISEMQEIIMLQGILNMAKAEFGLTDKPAF